MDLFGRLIDLIVLIWKFFIPFVVVKGFEQGVVLTWGKYTRSISGDDGVFGTGFHWIAPFYIETVITDVVVLRVINLSAQSLTTKDGRTVVIGGIARASISDIRKATMDVDGVDGAVRDSCLGAIGTLVEESTWDEMLKAEFREELLRRVRDEVRDFGVKIKSVKLSDKAPSRAYRFHIDQFNIGRGDDAEEKP